MVEPIHQPKSEEIFATIRIPQADIKILEGLSIEPGERDLDHRIAIPKGRERVFLVARALQTLGREAVAVDNDHPAGSHVVDVGVQCRRIESDQYVGVIGWGSGVR